MDDLLSRIIRKWVSMMNLFMQLKQQIDSNWDCQFKWSVAKQRQVLYCLPTQQTQHSPFHNEYTTNDIGSVIIVN